MRSVGISMPKDSSLRSDPAPKKSIRGAQFMARAVTASILHWATLQNHAAPMAAISTATIRATTGKPEGSNRPLKESKDLASRPAWANQ